ncbi:MAG: pyruvate kinase [Phycisphaerales bacterium]
MTTLRRPTLTAIIATLGPASESPEMVRKLILGGVSIFRLNFSHGDLPKHAERLKVVRAVAREIGTPVAVLGDLQGPKIRVGVLPPDGVTLEAGQDVLFDVTSGAAPAVASGEARAAVLPCEYEAIVRDVQTGHRVLVNDGAIRLLAVDSQPDDPPHALRCRVVVGGLVTSRKGINLPDSNVRAPAITERDWECVQWSVQHGLDFLALSFVRRAEEVATLRKALAGMCSVDPNVESMTGEGAMIPVVAKIEKPQAVANIDAILEVADAIMVARGDLGVEMELPQVPIVQKLLLEKSDEWGKPCIVATQMLETMIENATPTRAEVSDVAHAVFDGADAVMLSGETAVGRHPLLVVETMRRTIEAAEARMAGSVKEPSPPARLIESRYRTAALAHGAWHVARDLGAKLVVCWSQRGGAARYLSQNGFAFPIIAYSSDERETRRMALLRGVTAIYSPVPAGGSLGAWNEQADRELVARGWAAVGDPIVLIAGRPLGQSGAANTVAVHYVGNSFTGFRQHA